MNEELYKEEQYEQITVKAKSGTRKLRVYPEGTVEMLTPKDKNYFVIEPKIFKCDITDRKSKFCFMNEYVIVDIAGRIYSLAELVGQAYHPDCTPSKSLDEVFFRDGNIKNCSVGNLILKYS